MHWRTCDLGKVGLPVAGMLLLLVLMTWIPASAATVHERGSESATKGSVTMQATPVEDATVTALNKEKLIHENDWWWNYGATLLTSVISTLTLAAAGVFTVVRYFNDRRDTRQKQEAEALRLADDRKIEREKRAEERFQAVVEGLGSEREEAKVGAAITLRTFLRPSYEQFYTQTFDLAVAHLRLQTPSPLQDNPPPFLPSLHQALIVIFKEAFPLARSQNTGSPQSLDATGIHLDHASLRTADLEHVWMPQASLRKADLVEARLIGADLSEADLSGAVLVKADLRGARLNMSDLSGAILIRADLRGAELREANLSGATLREANLDETCLDELHSLKGTDLCGAKGLTKKQRASCKAKGAIVDEDLIMRSSQPSSVPSPSPQRKDAQHAVTQSAPENPQTLDTDGNSIAADQENSNA